MRVGNGNHNGFLQLRGLLHDQIDDLLGLGVVDHGNIAHGSWRTAYQIQAETRSCTRCRLVKRHHESKKTGWAMCPARPNLNDLENKLQRKLNQTWISVAIVGRNLAKSVIPCARVGTVEAGPRDAKLRVIEQVEELGAELNTESFGNLRPLEYGEIKVIDSGSAQRGIHTRFGTIAPRRRC